MLRRRYGRAYFLFADGSRRNHGQSLEGAHARTSMTPSSRKRVDAITINGFPRDTGDNDSRSSSELLAAKSYAAVSYMSTSRNKANNE